jgi:hypothetical protein
MHGIVQTARMLHGLYPIHKVVPRGHGERCCQPIPLALWHPSLQELTLIGCS